MQRLLGKVCVCSCPMSRVSCYLYSFTYIIVRSAS
uniref:Uncharacterized protein n=1 Tax=Anguilla anguilla TaxID=7936 RepID=A0A0E9SLZ4_ANGAN